MSAANGSNNEGHGHVYPRPDGARMRCGGPGLCKECAADAARKLLGEQAEVASKDARIAELEAEIARLREAQAPLTRLQPATVAEIAAARAALAAPDTGGADGE